MAGIRVHRSLGEALKRNNLSREIVRCDVLVFQWGETTTAYPSHLY